LKGLEIGSLHDEGSEESGEEELDLIPGRSEDDPLLRYLDGEMRERLTTAINDLPERERLIMTLYYYEETTMKEIGIILGVVESRISQIHASAVLHLRALLSAPAPLEELRRHQSTKDLRNQVRPKIRGTTPDPIDYRHARFETRTTEAVILTLPCCLRRRDLWNSAYP
jgi:Sigma-70, region 4